jgi:membrane protein YqaA with SNARE-associated domain
MMKRLYNWCLSLADKPSAPYALGAISFAESSFFPLPPDLILIPMSLARPERAWFYDFGRGWGSGLSDRLAAV